MMSDQLRILVNAGINIGSSIGKINEQIKAIEKHPSLQKIKLKIDIDQKFTQSLNQFIAAVSKMKKIADDQSRAISETQNVYKELDGTVKTVTQSVLKSGEVLEKTKIVHDANKKSIKSETTALNEQKKSLENILDENERYNKSLKDTSKYTSSGALKGSTHVLGEDGTGNTIKVNADKDGNVTSFAIDENYQKSERLAEALHQKELKRIQDEEKAWYEAYSEKEKREEYLHGKRIQDTYRAYDLAKKEDVEYNAKRLKAEQDFDASRQKMEAKIADVRRRFGQDVKVSSGLDQLETKLSGLKFNGNFRRDIDSIDTGLKKVIATADTASSHALSFGEQFKVALSRFPVWIAASTLVMGSIHQLTSGIAYIKDFDDALVNLSKVVDLTDQQLQAMSDSAISLGKELGKSSVDIMNAYAEFGRQFKTPVEIEDVTRSAVLASNVTSLTAADAAKTLTTAMIAFGLQAKDSISIVDSLNEVQNNYRISAEDLADSLSKVGSLAKLAGSSFQSLEGATTAIVSSTGISGNEAGTALKSFISRLFTVGEDGADDAGKSEALLKSLGIEIRKSATEFKGFDDILKEINEKWSTWGSITKQNVAQQIGSQYHVSKFVSLMDNYATSVEATSVAMNSQGSAIEENSKYLDSITGKWQIFLTTMQGKWNSAIDSDLIKGLIDGLTIAIDKLGNMGTVLSYVATGLLIFKGKAIYDFFKNFSLSLILTNSKLVQTQASLAGLTAAEIAAMSSTTGLKFALTGLWASMAANPLGLIATGLTVAITLFDLFGKSSDDTNEKFKELNDTYKEQSDQIQSLTSYYNQNHDQINSNKDVKDQLFQMQNKLIDTFGKEAEGLDLINGKYQEQTAIIDKLNQKSLENQIKDNQLLVDNLNDKNYSQPSLAYKPTLRREVGLDKNLSYDVAGDAGVGNLDVVQYYEELSKLYGEIQDKSEAAFAGSKLIPSNTKEWSNALLAVKDKMDAIKPMVDNINNLEDLKKQKIEVSTIAQEKFNESQRTMFDGVSNILKNTQTTDEYGKSISDVSQVIKSVDSKNIADVVENIKKLPNINLDSTITSQLDNLLTSEDQLTDSTGQSISKFQQLQENVQGVTSELKTINQTIDDVTSGQSLNAETTADLIAKYPQLAQFITKTADGWTIEKTALENLRQVKLDEANISFNAEKNKSLATLNNTLARIGMYQVEMKALETLEGRQKVINDLNSKKVVKPSIDPSNPFAWTAQSLNTGIDTYNEPITQAQNQVKDMGNLVDQINAYNKVINDTTYGVSADKSKKKSSASKDDPNFQSVTDARINKINAQSDAQSKLNDTLKSTISTDSSLATQMNQTTDLISAQTNEMDLLRDANTKLLDERKKIQDKNTKYDMSTWIDENGEATESFLKLFNSMKSGKAQDSLQSLYDDYSAYTLAIRENRASVSDLIKENKELSASLIDLREQNTKAWLESADKSYSAFEDQITASERLQSRYSSTDGDDRWMAEQQKQIAIRKAYQDQLNKDNSTYRARIEASKSGRKEDALTATQLQDLQDKIKSNSDAWWDLDDSIRNSTASMEQFREDAADKILTQVKEKELGLIEDIAEAEDKRHEARMDNLDKEMNRYQDAIDQIRKSMDREQSEDSFNKDLAKAQAEELDLRTRINALDLDDSVETQYKKRKLEEELAAKVEDIEQMKNDRTYKLRNDNLDDLLETKQKEIDAQKETEDTLYESNKENLDRIKEDITNFWDALIEDDNTHLMNQQGIINSHLAAVESSLKAFATSASSIARGIGSALSSAIAGVNTDVDFGTTPTVQDKTVIDQMKQNSTAWKTASASEKAALEATNKQLGAQIGATYNSGSGTWTKNGVRIYHKGGEVGVDGTSQEKWTDKLLKQGELPAILKEGEVVLNDPMKLFKDVSGSLLKNIGNLIIRPIQQPSQSGSTFNFDKLIHVDKIEKDVDVDRFMNLLDRKFKQLGFNM